MSKALWENPIADGEEEITNTIENLLQGGNMYVRPEDGRIAAKGKEQPLGTPWIHIQHGVGRHCGLWNQIYCQHFNLIPYYCRYHCWKTVIKPRTVEELFNLEGHLHSMNLPAKCGIDVRNYTPWPYAGFIYGDSLEEGRQYCSKIQQVINQFERDWKVILKRGCTEMELMRPSDQWDPMTEEEKRYEQKLDHIFVKEESYGKQDDWLKNSIRRRWLRHAMSIGDETWRSMAGHIEGMSPHVVEYQDYKAFDQSRTVEKSQLNSYLYENLFEGE